ncbi:Protein of unknown function [Paenibacillus sp. 1_12]|uniref:DUF3006 domain-containing protein n=1 Tax=Paenibacillus sp. 1_12 TaxID=1566278 RepID=UPI0008F249AF|nr:DUF3006 domain-containing protein [Paenibacillus sp. 1_12]SFM52796.1 Protein of unknown function [Paenibacillus sp. 1_12]
MIGIVDRYEGEFVVIEIDGDSQDIPKSLVADDVQPGDMVELQNEIWVKTPSATEERSKEIKKLMDSVWDD